MSAAAVETLLARLYTDDGLRRRFLDDTVAVALRMGLDDEEAAAFARIDRVGLAMAAESYARKRERGG
jgi:hypothetical protein